MRQKKVLIIDDEKRMADSLRDLLRDCGFTAKAAYGGVEGLDALKREAYHVVVTDLRMNNVDGLEVIRYIAGHHPNTLVIVITGHASTESAIEALHYQVYDYLRKPFEFSLFRMAIEKAFQKIETEQLREDVAAMITHDIKIPLTSIIGFATMMVDRDTGEIHPRFREFVQTIQANGHKILMLIENYLTTCKIEAGTLKVTPVPMNLSHMLTDLIEAIQPELTRRSQKLAAQMDDRLELADLDEMLIYRAIGNLLQNAIKHSEGIGDIQLRLVHVSADESPLYVETLRVEVINRVTDLGAEHLEAIFQRFKQSPVRPGVEGSGIGLYVVHAVAQAHGGLIDAEILDRGCIRFVMNLPLKSTIAVHDAGS